ncbi:MAG: hypothetical protein J6K05_05790 [Bacteroidaceae bacterium]|nr:hypothetical protein [Bacteroidaceae bacterium]
MNYKEQLIFDINRLCKENEVTDISFIDIINDILEKSPNDELIRGISANWNKRSKSIELIWDINQFKLFQVDVSYRIYEDKTSWNIQYLFKKYNEIRNENKTFIEHLNICLNHIRRVKKNFESKLKTKGEFYEELIKQIDWHIASSIRNEGYNAEQMVLGINLNNYRPEINIKEQLLNHDIYDLTDYLKCFFIDPNNGGYWDLKDDTLFWELAKKYIEDDREETRISQIKKIKKITSNEFRKYFYNIMYEYLAELNAVKSGRMPIYLKIYGKTKKKRFLGVEPNSLRPHIGILEGLDGCDIYDLKKIEEAFLTDDDGCFVSTNKHNSKFILKDKSLINQLVERYFTDKNFKISNLPLIKNVEESTINDESLFIKIYNTVYTDKFSFYPTIVGKYSDVSYCNKYCYYPKSLYDFIDFLEKSYKAHENNTFKALDYFDKAKNHKRNKKYNLAITALEKAIKLLHDIEQTGYPEIHSCLIDCYAKIKDKENQIRVVKLAIELYDSPKYKNMLNRIMGTISDTSLNNDSYTVIAECNYGEMYDKHVRQKLPEFSFGKRPVNWDVYERADMLPVIRKIDKHFQDTLKQAKDAEMLEDYERAVELYERLISEGIYTPNAYERLIVLYSKSKRNNDLIRILQKGISFFETRKYSQLEYVRALAKKYGAEGDCEKLIEQGRKIRYYCGYIILYQDYPFVDKWKKRLAKLIQ